MSEQINELQKQINELQEQVKEIPILKELVLKQLDVMNLMTDNYVSLKNLIKELKNK